MIRMRRRIDMFAFHLVSGSLLLHLVMSSGSRQHSLWALATYISGSTQFPEFSVVLMLDDIQVGYYDSETEQLVSAGAAGEKGAELGLGQEVVFVLQEMLQDMRKRLNLFRDQLNLTTPGVHVQQRMTGCEVQEGLIMFRDGANGQDTDGLQYNMTHFLYVSSSGWQYQWDALKQSYMQMIYSNVFLPLCIRSLQHLLDREKHLILRRVPPRLRLTSHPVVGGAQVTCLATDFYPRHINLTLLRDGEPVDEDQLSSSSVLPNGNGLYQLRKTMTVDEEELQRKHKYTCAATHLSLDNRLDVSWRAESFRSHRVHIISAPVVLMVATILLLVLLMRRRRKRAGSEGVTMETQQQPAESEGRN